jgi:hypothetical protein
LLFYSVTDRLFILLQPVAKELSEKIKTMK